MSSFPRFRNVPIADGSVRLGIGLEALERFRFDGAHLQAGKTERFPDLLQGARLPSIEPEPEEENSALKVTERPEELLDLRRPVVIGWHYHPLSRPQALRSADPVGVVVGQGRPSSTGAAAPGMMRLAAGGCHGAG